MGAKPGNKNATKKGLGRIDVHISIADDRRAKLERRLKGEEVTADAIRKLLYEWIDALP